MSNVLIDRQKIDILANAISDKSGVPVTMTLDEMVEAVDGIEMGGITPTGNIDITSAGVTDVTNYATATVPEGEIYLSEPYVSFITENGVREYVIMSYAEISSGDSHGKEGYIADDTFVQDTTKGNAIATGTSVTPTESAQTIGGQKYMLEGAVTVNAIPSNYVGSGVTQRASSDLTVSGATITAPAGYYASSASKAVASGTAGTPTATKGTVSNHAITVTPSVTNTTGYITGSTKTGTGVSVSASELVSGTYSVTSSGTKDVTNYASASVPSGTEGTPSATKGTVSSHSISVTPSVTNTAGYISGGTHNGTAVTVSASELVSGSETKTANGTYDVTNLAQIIVNVSGGGGGGLEYETGTWTPSEDIAQPTISFTNSHTTPPIHISFVDATNDYGTSGVTNVNMGFEYTDWWRLTKAGLYYASSTIYYGVANYWYRTSNAKSFTANRAYFTVNSDNATDSGTTYPRYWANETGFRPYTSSTSRHWLAGRTYKWIAVWAPTT